jgi:peptidoglycan-N-acetylglucosamine deacetylase
LEAFDRDAADVVPPDKIIGFRAPTFSLDESTSWAIDVLRAHGLRYDSSLFPMRTRSYGIADGPTRPYHPTSAELTQDHPGVEFVEFPLAIGTLAGHRVPLAGGFSLRAMPLFTQRRLLGELNSQGDPFVLHLPCWAADAHAPRVRGMPLAARLITYFNRAATLHKLEGLLQSFAFAPMREVLGLRGGRVAPRA